MCGSLPIYVGVLGYGWGNGPIHLGDVFDGSLGFWTLPDLPITLGNGPGIDFWNAPSSDYWTTSCTSYCSSRGYMTFPQTPCSVYPGHSVRQWWSPSSFGRLPTEQPHMTGEGIAPLPQQVNLQFHQGVPSSITSLGGRRGFPRLPSFIVPLCRRGTPVPCLVGIHCGICLLLLLGKCDILLVARLTDLLQGQAPSHYLSSLSTTCILPLATLWLRHVGTFHGGSQVSAGFLDPTWDTHPGRDPTLPFVLPP